MARAFLAFNQYNIPIIKMDKFHEGEAREWAIDQLNKGKKVYQGKFVIKHYKWIWYIFIPNKRIDKDDPGTHQPTP